MALLNILRYPDARLHKVAVPVTVFDEPLKRLVADLAETMYEAPERLVEKRDRRGKLVQPRVRVPKYVEKGHKSVICLQIESITCSISGCG